MLNDENIERLEIVANGMGELADKMVFLGGAVTNLYIDDPAAERIRPTLDVDCIIEIGSKSAYNKFEDELRGKGFCHFIESGAPICRWIYNGILVDIIPTDERIFGFTNQWYRHGIRNNQKIQLPSGKIISILTLPYFIATKIEAYYGRDEKDFRISHDIEDIINVLDGSLSFDAFVDIPKDLNKYLVEQFSAFLVNPQFIESVSSHIEFSMPAPGRVKRIINFMRSWTNSE